MQMPLSMPTFYRTQHFKRKWQYNEEENVADLYKEPKPITSGWFSSVLLLKNAILKNQQAYLFFCSVTKSENI